MTNETDYSDVTEMAGEQISEEQLFRMANRYYWAKSYIEGKDVVEVACGTGPGLGYLLEHSKTVRAGDFSDTMVEQVKSHYGNRIDVQQYDAQSMPYKDNSVDVILIFEALYYLPSAEEFVAECKRILRPSGVILVSNANKDLYDFNPSPYSFVYHGVEELDQLFEKQGFETEFFGSIPLTQVSLKQKILRPIKKFIVTNGLMPKSMMGKRLLKRFVFGSLIPMPHELNENSAAIEKPTKIHHKKANEEFKVIYCAARLT